MGRIVDIALALAVIILLSPFWILLAIALRCTGEGKIFYLQPRVGFMGRKFNIVKFATMLEKSPSIGTGEITLRNDPRVLPLGKFLRKSKINELPLMINLLKGDMTLVGPRPVTPSHFDVYPDHVKKEIVKVRPGLTGLGSLVFRDEEAIISRSSRPFRECYAQEIAPYKGELELYYVRNKSFVLDAKIVLLTAISVVLPKNKLYRTWLKGAPFREC